MSLQRIDIATQEVFATNHRASAAYDYALRGAERRRALGHPGTTKRLGVARAHGHGSHTPKPPPAPQAPAAHYTGPSTPPGSDPLSRYRAAGARRPRPAPGARHALTEPVPASHPQAPQAGGRLSGIETRALLLGLLLSAVLCVLWPSNAKAASPAPNLDLHLFYTPTSFSSSDTGPCEETLGFPIYVTACDEYQITATNTGAQATGSPVTLSATLPENLEIPGTSGFQAERHRLSVEPVELSESCKLETLSPPVKVKCKFAEHLAPDEAFQLIIAVHVSGAAVSGEQIGVSLSGGGAPERALTSEDKLDQPPPFGLSDFQTELTGPDGSTDNLAGDHPYEYRTHLDLNNIVRLSPASTLQSTTVEDPRDVIVDLPVGLVGAATATPYCTLTQLSSLVGCPSDTRVGQILSEPLSNASVNSAVYNLVPEKGSPAEFGFEDLLDNVHVIYASVVPGPEGYVTRATTREIPQIPLGDVNVTFFGDPQAKNSGPAAPPMFSNSTDCDGQPLTTHAWIDSWQSPGSYAPEGTPDLQDSSWVESSSQSAPPVQGCGELSFEPSLSASLASPQADSPSAFDVDIKLPQPQGAEERATPPLRDAEVTLPEGLNVNPSSANGLKGCSLARVGISAQGLPDASPPACPEESKIGTVELETPALPSEACRQEGPSPAFRNLSECPDQSEREKIPLTGSIYVANQTENPFGSLLAIYIVVNDPRTGVIVKIPAEVKADEATGQLTTLVKNSPQFPFTELRTHFFGGPGASLRTPAVCSSYAVGARLTPYSAPESGPAATPQGPFAITEGPAGSPACAHSPAEEPNSPAFAAAAETPAAGAFSPVIVNLSREDGSQNFSAISVTLPPGSSGRIAGIPRCSEAQIAQAQARNHLGEGALEAASPSCPQSSAIGTVTVGAGAGPHPFYVTGNAYLAGPYKGAPFSAVFITPAIAGPFDLGTVLVRAALYIDPSSAQVTTASDPLPTILHGIPLDIRSVSVNVSRPGFTLNPTSCDPMTVTGRETSTLGSSAPLSARFQVGGCSSLPFKPKLTASVAGKATKANGTSFTVNVTSAGLGQANIAKVHLQLPKTLPSRLSTIQKACPAQIFEANPASCDEGSVIGTGTAHTPLLQAPLSGPAYLVSHGNAAFPDVEFVLQGEGVLLILDGKTDIKKGITYSRFETVPDAPVSSFTASLPAGPHSALTSNVPEKEHFSLCKAGASLVLPTEITAQSGAVIKQNTKAVLTGCKATKHLTNKQKLQKALKACKKKPKKKRHACERAARKRFPVKKGKGKHGGKKGTAKSKKK